MKEKREKEKKKKRTKEREEHLRNRHIQRKGVEKHVVQKVPTTVSGRFAAHNFNSPGPFKQKYENEALRLFVPMEAGKRCFLEFHHDASRFE